MRYRIAVGGCKLRRREEPVTAPRDRVDAVGSGHCEKTLEDWTGAELTGREL